MVRFAVACVFALAVPGSTFAGEEKAPSFGTEIIPLLTKAGCNQGACHGKGAGQNGFRLSLRGFAPEQDHRWITREFDGRRLDPAKPEESLILRKATGQTPHEGGRLFARAGDVPRRSRRVRLQHAVRPPGGPEAVPGREQLRRYARPRQAPRTPHRAVGPVLRRGVRPPPVPRRLRHSAGRGGSDRV